MARAYARKPAYSRSRTPIKARGFARKAAPRRSIVPRAPAPKFDGQRLLINAYFEVVFTQPSMLGTVPSIMAYAITCDPNNCVLKLASTGDNCTITATDGVNAVADGAVLSFDRFTTFKNLYRQYCINSVKVNITTDRECGLDNPLLMLTDKGEATVTPETTVARVMAQAHKSAILTESRRTAQYGWTAKTTQEKEWQMLHSSIPAPDLTSLKILQEVEGKADGVCKHRVQLSMVAVLKDSKSSAN